jgi:hypothetical protein
MQSSSFSLSALQTTAWLYVVCLVVAGAGGLFGLCSDLIALAVQVIRTVFAQTLG